MTDQQLTKLKALLKEYFVSAENDPRLGDDFIPMELGNYDDVFTEGEKLGRSDLVEQIAEILEFDLEEISA